MRSKFPLDTLTPYGLPYAVRTKPYGVWTDPERTTERENDVTMTPTDQVESTPASDEAADSPFMPPRWFVRTAWIAHRALFRGTGGRRGLWPPKPGKWGTMRLVTVGRKTGKEREAIVAYFEDGTNIVTMAMNGWGEGEPAWWLNLLDHPDARSN